MGGEPPIVFVFIGLNLAVYLAWKTSPDSRFMIDNFTCSAERVFGQYRLHTLITSAFSHESFLHLLCKFPFRV